MTIQKIDRNQRIAEQILLGESPSKVAREYALTTARASKILHTYCWKKDREVYLSFTGGFTPSPTLEQLRGCIDVFLGDNNEVLLYSPVSDIKSFPMKLINTLIRNEIYTADDLMKADLNRLKRYPCIGPVALDRIAHFQKKYQHLVMA